MPIPSLILHHYTSGQALLGIVESNSLWATNIHYMNDSKEFGHSVDLASMFIRRRQSERSDEKFKAVCDAALNHLERISGLALYVTCFSEVGDSLSQWRGYCPPSFGYCLGFDGEMLQEIVKKQGFTLQQCIYDSRRQESSVNDWVNTTLASLYSACPASSSVKAYCEQHMWPCLLEFIKFAPYMKNSAFKDEREWRLVGLVLSDEPAIKLRPSRSMLVPYVPIQLQMSLTDSPLWDIRVGPTPHIELAMNALTHLFRKVRIRNGIGHTSIPYRDW